MLAAKEGVPIYREESLSAKRARAIIIAAFPEFRGARVELLDEGWDFQVFEDDAGWLFRFPKREGGVAKLNMERKLLPGLGEWVSLPVPNYEYFCESHEADLLIECPLVARFRFCSVWLHGWCYCETRRRLMQTVMRHVIE